MAPTLPLKRPSSLTIVAQLALILMLLPAAAGAMPVAACTTPAVGAETATPAGCEAGEWTSIQDQIRQAEYHLTWHEPRAAYVAPSPAYASDQVVKLTAADGAAFDGFGISVSISGDTLVVGAFGDDDDDFSSGSAYVFARNQGGADGWGQVTKLTATDGVEYAHFGHSVSISGDTIVVGADGDDDYGSYSGSAYIFVRNQGGADAWGQVAKLTAGDGAAHDYFGCSVSVSGDTVVVGAWGDDDRVSSSGSAYVFARNQGGANAWGQVAKLIASYGATDDMFGYSVSISGDTIVVGASEDDLGSFYAAGSAYIFARDQDGPDAWGQVAKLTASDRATVDRFGYSVSISGDTVVVGADLDDDRGSSSGSAYVFARNEGGADAWGQVGKLSAGDGAADDRFGSSVSVSGGTVVVGASGDDIGDFLDRGSAHVYRLDQLLLDLDVAKSNSGTPVMLGDTWEWWLVVTNHGTARATFDDGETLLSDQLPIHHVDYGAVTVDNQGGVDGVIECSITAGLLTCMARDVVALDAGIGTFRVRLPATPAAAGIFTNPTGGRCVVDPNDAVVENDETNNDCNRDTVTVDIEAYTLTVHKVGDGSGTVTSSPAGIVCGTTCQAIFAEGKTVTLSASAGDGSTFVGWSGTGCSGTGTCQVLMTEARQVTATFARASTQIYLPLVLSRYSP